MDNELALIIEEVIRQIKEGVDAVNKNYPGIIASYPESVTIEKGGFKINIPLIVDRVAQSKAMKKE
jgi:hypothetical protein